MRYLGEVVWDTSTITVLCLFTEEAYESQTIFIKMDFKNNLQDFIQHTAPLSINPIFQWPIKTEATTIDIHWSLQNVKLNLKKQYNHLVIFLNANYLRSATNLTTPLT